MKKICEFDGVEFDGRADAKFCSPKCRKAAARAAGVDADTGEVLNVTPKAETPYTPGMNIEPATEVTVTLSKDIDWREYHNPKSPHYIKNPFDRPKDPNYDSAKALAAFKKMGLETVKWLSTGISDFDKLTKIPRGRITQIQGPYGVGKTTLCLNMIAGMQNAKVLYIDSEASLNPELLEELGVNHKNFELYNKSAKLEDISEVIRKAAADGSYDAIIFDSLASVTTETIAEGKMTDSNIGQKAKIIHKLISLVQMDLKNNDTALVVINQEREVLGGYVPQKYTPGGMGIPYAASLMISLKTIKSWRFGRTASDTKAKKFIGQEVEATIIKSKVNTPWRTAKFQLYYPKPREDEDDGEALF